jgi:cysteinyl-tRNA synthetase
VGLVVYNTLKGEKEPFVPLIPGKVRLYVCGPTVYDMSHIGHARAYVAFDVVQRYLRRSYQVTHVRNYTDVDDKIIKRGLELGEASTVVSERFIDEFKTDMRALGVQAADVEPKVTEHIPEIIQIIEKLIARGMAYASGGDVYYAVEKFKGYGKLSKRSIEDMEAGARVEVSEQKRHPMDFALWKAAKPGEPFWKSPWGDGRPGWHIECSAMSSKYLGETFDIHGGGKDLVFPHHENEIAQSEAASGKPFARYWLHNGFVNVDNEKMSKSLGNFFTIRDVLQKFDAQSLRYFLLTTHYRSPINFSDKNLAEAEARVKYLYETLARVAAAVTPGSDAPPYRDVEVDKLDERFAVAMDDDFNTAKVLGDVAGIFRIANEILQKPEDKERDARTLRAIQRSLADIGSVLGLFTEDPATVLKRIESRRQKERGIDSEKIEGLIAERNAARRQKDFARADAIRKELAALGVTIKDSPTGTTWEVG